MLYQIIPTIHWFPQNCAYWKVRCSANNTQSLPDETDFISNLKSRYKRAFVNWKRAAAQGFGGARLKLGDYYYYGQGNVLKLDWYILVPEMIIITCSCRNSNHQEDLNILARDKSNFRIAGTDADPVEAAEQYQIASDVDHNPQAMFNLGYMHELGIGRAQVWL